MILFSPEDIRDEYSTCVHSWDAVEEPKAGKQSKGGGTQSDDAGTTAHPGRCFHVDK